MEINELKIEVSDNTPLIGPEEIEHLLTAHLQHFTGQVVYNETGEYHIGGFFFELGNRAGHLDGQLVAGFCESAQFRLKVVWGAERHGATLFKVTRPDTDPDTGVELLASSQAITEYTLRQLLGVAVSYVVGNDYIMELARIMSAP